MKTAPFLRAFRQPLTAVKTQRQTLPIKKGDEIIIEDELLLNIGSFSLGEFDFCTLKNHLELEPSMIMYIKNCKIFDDDFLNGVLEDFVIVQNIVENMQNFHENINDEQCKLIKESFFVLFKFISSSLSKNPSIESSRCYKFIVFKMIMLKCNLKLDDDEQELVELIENRFSRETISNQINNMLAKSDLDPQEHGFLFKVDPNQEFLNFLKKSYSVHITVSPE